MDYAILSVRRSVSSVLSLFRQSPASRRLLLQFTPSFFKCCQIKRFHNENSRILRSRWDGSNGEEQRWLTRVVRREEGLYWEIRVSRNSRKGTAWSVSLLSSFFLSTRKTRSLTVADALTRIVILSSAESSTRSSSLLLVRPRSRLLVSRRSHLSETLSFGTMGFGSIEDRGRTESREE